MILAGALDISISLLLVAHVVVSLMLILVVLMQRPKQEGLGAAFGGGMTDQMFGAQTTNVLQKGTAYFGTAFLVLSLVLAILIGKRNHQDKIVDTPAPEVIAAPAVQDVDPDGGLEANPIVPPTGSDLKDALEGTPVTPPVPVPTPDPEGTPAPETESTPEAETESTPEPDTESTPEPETESTPEPETESTPEPETESTPEPDTESTPEPETESTPEPETESTPEPETEPTPEPAPAPSGQ